MLEGGRASDLILVPGGGVASVSRGECGDSARAGLRWVAQLVMLVL